MSGWRPAVNGWRTGEYPRQREDEGIAKDTIATESGPERAILVAVELRNRERQWSLEDTLSELAYLARTAGATVVGRITQRSERLTPTYLGKGKIQELCDKVAELGADVVIFDDELTPSQQRKLEDSLGTKVIDRTVLILDVFGRHARTHEGKLQVELAQHQYLFPRLAGQWSHLERLGGGIGTRGPGETQLETDRRLVRRRIQRIEQELQGVRRRRSVYIGRRKKSSIPTASLVGYTNAGKSTLFNALSDADVDVQDQLFSTLDPVTRRVRLPSGGQLLLTDTVGFIQKLSPMVVAAFRATLEELAESDILLHVVDITHPKAQEQTEVVETILDDLGLGDRPRLLVANKIDLLPRNEENNRSGHHIGWNGQSGVQISAAKNLNLDQLLKKIESRLMVSDRPLTVVGTGAGS